MSDTTKTTESERVEEAIRSGVRVAGWDDQFLDDDIKDVARWVLPLIEKARREEREKIESATERDRKSVG